MTASPGGTVVQWTLYGCGCYVIWCGADLPEMVRIRRDSPALMRISYRPVTPGRHQASANNSTCGIWHTCAAWKTTHFKNNCCLPRRAKRRSATGSDWPTTIRSTRASCGARSSTRRPLTSCYRQHMANANRGHASPTT